MIFEGRKKSIFFGLGLTRAGIGFPDINTLEPLANALEMTVLELMRSKRADMENKNDNLSDREVAEIMVKVAEMTRESQRQAKVALWIAGIVTVVKTISIKLSGGANFGGSIFAGAMVALAVVGMYLFVKNKEDKEGRIVFLKKNRYTR